MNPLKIGSLSGSALAMGALLITILPAQAGDIVFAVEEPVASKVHSGIANLRGWAASSAGVDRVELYVDGVFTTDIPSGGRRTDVGRVYPDYPDSSNSGFSMAFNYSNLTAGPHQFRIRVVDRDNDSREQIVSFDVARFDTPYIADPAQISLASASSALDARSILLRNMTADGQAYDVRLDWRTEVQGFVIAQITPAGQPPADNFSGVYRSRLSLTGSTCAFAVGPESESELNLIQRGSQISGTESGQLTVAGTVDALGYFALTSQRLTQTPTANCRGESYFSYQGHFPGQTVDVTILYEYFGSCPYSNCAARFKGNIVKTDDVDDSSVVSQAGSASARSILQLLYHHR